MDPTEPATPEDRASWPRPRAVYERGDSIDRFIVLDRIGDGGMGVVYKAYDPQLDRRIALKLLRRPDDDARFLREAQAIAQLVHPNVVTIFDAGRSGGDVYLAMEFVDGTTLAGWLASEPRSLDAILDRFVEAGRGLAAAHAKGIVHRDVKPGNILVPTEGEARIADFGLAHSRGDEPGDSGPPQDHGVLDRAITRTGAVVGTPRYMAPEQFEGKRTDARTDVFALAVALYEAVAGTTPFAGETFADLGKSVVAGAYRPPPRAAGVPAWLERILARALACAPADRFQTVDALLAAIQRGRTAGRRRVVAAAVVAGVAGLGVLGYLALRPHAAVDPCANAGAELAAVWRADRKAAIATAFAAVQDAKDPAGAAAKTTTALDDYTGAWRAMRVDACKATRVRGGQSEVLLDRRVECLDRRLGAVSALVADLVKVTTPKEVRRARGAVDALTPLAGCADANALLARIPPPEDPAVRARVAAVRKRLDDAWADRDLGRYDQALAAAQAIEPDADATGYAPVQAEVRALLSAMYGTTDDTAHAEQVLREMVTYAARAHDDSQLADAYAALVWTIGGDVGARPADALPLIPVAEAAIDRAGNDKVRLKFLRNSGIVYEALGKLDEADRRYVASLELERTKFPDDWEGISTSLQALCIVRQSENKPDEALDFCRQALAASIKAFGADHPGTAADLANLGAQLVDMGKFDEGRPYLEQAYALGTKSGRSDIAISAGFSLAEVLRDQDKYADALERFVALRALAADKFGDDHPYLFGIDTMIGLCDIGLGKLADAEPPIAHAVAGTAKLPGDDHTAHAFAVQAMGNLRAAQGKHRDAIAQYQTALGLPNLQPRMTASIRLDLAKSQWAAGQRDAAKATTAAARADAVAAGSSGTWTLGQIDAWLAKPGG